MRWTQAAVFGDCKDYLAYSEPDPSQPDLRSPDQLCHDLRASSAQARADSIKIGLRLGRVLPNASGAEVEIVLIRKGVTNDVSMTLAKVHGSWRVIRDPRTCRSLGCP
ncbi:MAG: hypothetical protein JWM02_1638 [Frankiales bacterium]|nr:hypothetical protein [Frankiales bacterium]